MACFSASASDDNRRSDDCCSQTDTDSVDLGVAVVLSLVSGQDMRYLCKWLRSLVRESSLRLGSRNDLATGADDYAAKVYRALKSIIPSAGTSSVVRKTIPSRRV
jgi:hypothetical protein